MVRARLVANGIEFFDGVANVNSRVGIAGPSSITPLDTEGFPVEVDRVFGIRSDRFDLESVPTIVIRDGNGAPVDTANRLGRTRHTAPETILELCTPLKLYLRTEGALTITCGDGRTEITLDRERQVEFGVRAREQAPQETVTTTTAIRDIFGAISTFGSAMTTFAPDRSLPTIRGHPPRIEFGEELDVPSNCEPPRTGIVVEAPATILHAAMAAPLTYYLGATLRPATTGRLRVHGDGVRDLAEGRAFGQRCHMLLRRMVLLDSTIAAERRYGIVTAERDALESATSIDWQAIADRPVAERVREYLAIGSDLLGEHLTRAHQPAFVTPTRRTVQSLPYLSFDLAQIAPPVAALPVDRSGAIPDGGMVRAPREGPRPQLGSSEQERPSGRGIGQHIPVGQHPAYPAAFHNRFRRVAEGDGISIAVVCNDSKMARESHLASAIYNSRERSPMTVDVHENLSRTELTAVMRGQSDYFHYIGHIEDGGFVCTDGLLDSRDLTAVGLELFFLNSCESLEQSIGLIEAGACGGIATRNRVPNRGAIRVGAEIAETLTRGYPLGLALRFARESHEIGEKYTIVGDPKTDLTATDSGIPISCHLRERGGDRYSVTVETHLTKSVGPGSLCSFHLGERVPYFVHPTRQSFDVDRSELIRFLELEDLPVRCDGEYRWSEAVVNELST